MNELHKFIAFIVTNQQELRSQISEHLWLTLVSLSLAVVVGLSLGIFITKTPKASRPVLVFVNAVQTIPSIALLGFLLPFFGIGAVPAIIALFLYGLLPIVRNTYSGIINVNPATKEAAIGMGLDRRQVLLKVELPLAMPVIFAGIRTAFVINVGVATLCALIAAGGLGEFIFRGLSTNNTYMILAGAIPAGVMALFFDWAMGLVQKHIYQLKKPLMMLVLLIAAFLIYKSLGQTSSHQWTAGFPSEFIGRNDGYIGMKEQYDLDLEVKEMEIGLMYLALKNGKVDLISGFSTDGRIEAFGLTILEDDKNYFPPYHAAPLVRRDMIQRYPDAAKALAMLSDKISDSDMSAMNFLVDEKQQNIREVARDFLKNLGLNTSVERKGQADIIIGSKSFTENFLLAEMFKLVIENYTGLTVELKLGFGGTKLLFDAMNEGHIDLYPEYTGTGLLVILQPEGAVLQKILYEKQEVLDYVQQKFQEKYNMEWLPPLGFNNTHAIMMRKKEADRLGIQKISDLSK
ncbi:ABC transporter permease subunit [Fulvivirga sp. M361]|uniref:ABC transporter permease/substrate-binding protein n=1 Tax=Fulvivirga sp. M361 TaxID=2594266 RepID=UPI00117BB94F|nr:ABC transporter permease/substrate-binding protein [Fulvivirga sp. M361]TRX62697.1 ABC transporter permease subunit [Fulvivirga sp. M361]